jgi:hypothetical protein
MRGLRFVGVATACWLVAACGKSTRDLPPADGGRGGGFSGSSGAASAGTGGADAGGASGSGAAGGASGAGAAGGVNSAGAAGAAEAGAAGNSGETALCGDHQGFVTITGELPAFGEDITLRSGCPNAPVPSYTKPASYKGGVGEGAGGLVRITACSDDGRLELEARFSYGFNRPDAGTPGLESATLRYTVDRVASSIPITNLSETKMPVENWLDVTLGTDAGVGGVYEGSFEAEGQVMGAPASVKVTFSVCHVANLAR